MFVMLVKPCGQTGAVGVRSGRVDVEVSKCFTSAATVTRRHWTWVVDYPDDSCEAFVAPPS